MKDFFYFKKMITPMIIQALFVLGLVACIRAGIIFFNNDEPGMGILAFTLSPVVNRVFCEILIVLFSINDTLTQIRNLLRDQVAQAGSGGSTTT